MGHGIYFKLGAGGAEADLRRQSTGERGRDRGFAFGAGLGFETPIFQPIQLGVNVDLVLQKFSSEADFASTNAFVAIGIGISYRTPSSN